MSEYLLVLLSRLFCLVDLGRFADFPSFVGVGLGWANLASLSVFLESNLPEINARTILKKIYRLALAASFASRSLKKMRN